LSEWTVDSIAQAFRATLNVNLQPTGVATAQLGAVHLLH
jgi:hypothetical protein